MLWFPLLVWAAPPPPCAYDLNEPLTPLGTLAIAWDPGFEPSGAAWLDQRLLVVGGDDVVAVVTGWDGPKPTVTYHTIDGLSPSSAEAVEVADGRVYLGLEGGTPQTATVQEVDPVDWTMTDDPLVFDTSTWNAEGFMKDNKGLEGMTLTTNGTVLSFWLGSQQDTEIHVVTDGVHTAYSHGLPCEVGECEASGMASVPFGIVGDHAGPIVFLSSDEGDRIAALTLGGATLGQVDLPGIGQEGIAIRGCELWVAQDDDNAKVASIEHYRFASAPMDTSASTPTTPTDTAGTSGTADTAGTEPPVPSDVVAPPQPEPSSRSGGCGG